MTPVAPPAGHIVIQQHRAAADTVDIGELTSPNGPVTVPDRYPWIALTRRHDDSAFSWEAVAAQGNWPSKVTRLVARIAEIIDEVAKYRSCF